MELSIEFDKQIATGKLPNGYHFTDGQFYLYYVHETDSTIQEINAFIDQGIWDYLSWSSPVQKAADDDVAEFSIYYIPGERTWFVWKQVDEDSDEDLHRMVVVPDEEPEVEPSPYKLYYAYDTKKLYMNTYEFWNFIATLRHGLMKELAEDHHLQYHNNDRHWKAHKNQSGEALPEADEEYRGLFFLVLNEESDDELYVCIQTGIDTYEWKQVTVS